MTTYLTTIDPAALAVVSGGKQQGTYFLSRKMSQASWDRLPVRAGEPLERAATYNGNLLACSKMYEGALAQCAVIPPIVDQRE